MKRTLFALLLVGVLSAVGELGISTHDAHAAAPSGMRLPFVGRVNYYTHGGHTGNMRYARDVTPRAPSAWNGAVVAMAPGKVILAEDRNVGPYCYFAPNGRQKEVRIEHNINGHRYLTVYAHLSSYSVRAGQQVSAGQTIGTWGDTGCATGRHLHFEVHRDGNWGQPFSGTNIPVDDLPGVNWPSRTAVGPPAAAPPSPPAPKSVLVDDGGAGFERHGPAQYWIRFGIGYDRDMYATWNNGPCSYGAAVCPQGSDVNYVVWRPSLAAGTYRVCAYIPPDHAYTRSARYKIRHAGGTSTVTINQQQLVGWKSLGVYQFNAGTGGYVRLGDWTAEAFASRQIGFDAIKWVAGGGAC
jgi:hypothetical protein